MGEHPRIASAESRLDTNTGRRSLDGDLRVDASQAAPGDAREVSVECRLLLGDPLHERFGSGPAQHQRLPLERDIPLDLGQQHGLASATWTDDDGMELVTPRTPAETREDGVQDLLTAGQQGWSDAESGVERVLRIILDTSALRRHHAPPLDEVGSWNEQLCDLISFSAAPMDTAGYLTSDDMDTVYERGVTR